MKVRRSRPVRRTEVTTDGRNLVSHAGTAMLAELADRTGLTRGLSEALAGCGNSWHTHDPGVVLTHLAVPLPMEPTACAASTPSERTLSCSERSRR